MNQTSETLTRLSTVNQAFIEPLPNSTKIFVEGSHPDIQVPMREIQLTDTIGDLAEVNEPIHIYDTSGPYTDPSKTINFREGVERIRHKWIEEKGDTEELQGFSSSFSNQRIQDTSLDGRRFEHTATPRRAKRGKNITQMHYAKQGIITPEMEFIAIRENCLWQEYKELVGQHKGEDLALQFLLKSPLNLYEMK